MSVRENIEVYGAGEGLQISDILVNQYGATRHPSIENAYVLEGVPFYAPRPLDDHISILSFNNTPLPDSLIQALVDHPELFPDEVFIRWTQEQDLILEATLGQLRGKVRGA